MFILFVYILDILRKPDQSVRLNNLIFRDNRINTIKKRTVQVRRSGMPLYRSTLINLTLVRDERTRFVYNNIGPITDLTTYAVCSIMTSSELFVCTRSVLQSNFKNVCPRDPNRYGIQLPVAFESDFYKSHF